MDQRSLIAYGLILFILVAVAARVTWRLVHTRERADRQRRVKDDATFARQRAIRTEAETADEPDARP